MTPVHTSRGLTVDLPDKIWNLQGALASAQRNLIGAPWVVVALEPVVPRLRADAELFGVILAMERHADKLYVTKSRAHPYPSTECNEG